MLNKLKLLMILYFRTLNSFWESNGKAKNYFATFSVLSFSEDEGYSLELIDHDKLGNSLFDISF